MTQTIELDDKAAQHIEELAHYANGRSKEQLAAILIADSAASFAREPEGFERSLCGE